MEGDIITLQDIFQFDFAMGIDEKGRFKGVLKPTGLRPKFSTRLQEYGINFSSSMFLGEE
jgi:pilus assembly protein CpaF